MKTLAGWPGRRFSWQPPRASESARPSHRDPLVFHAGESAARTCPESVGDVLNCDRTQPMALATLVITWRFLVLRVAKRYALERRQVRRVDRRRAPPLLCSVLVYRKREIEGFGTRFSGPSACVDEHHAELPAPVGGGREDGEHFPESTDGRPRGPDGACSATPKPLPSGRSDQPGSEAQGAAARHLA